MSTMDYLEFKNYLEHSFTQKDKAEYYKNKDIESIKRARYTDSKKAYLDFAKDVNEINALIKDYESKASKGANTYTLSKMSNQIIDRIKKNESKFGYPPVYLVDWAMKHGAKDSDFEYPLSHSNLSHASRAGMPTNIKKDQQDQIKKEIIRKIDAYLNSSKFTDIRSRGSFLTNEIKNMPGGGSIAQREMRKASLKGEASDKEAKKKAYDDLMTYIRKYSGSSAYANLFNQDEVELIYQLGSTHWGTARPYAEKLKQSLSHGNLEHGWFTDLFKKSYTAKGSTAGMPTNLPRTATSGGSAGSKQLVYSDQLRKLNNNLVEYELKMNQAKASYEEYRKLYNDTKKNIANTEKALTEATKEAARTGFDPSKSSVAAPARRYASSNAILPQTTITGSTEGLKKTRYHVKKKK